MAQPPVPNVANLTAAANGMIAEGNTIAQSVQAYSVHQQTLTTELSLFSNYNVIQQFAADIRADIAELRALNSAEFWNLRAEMQNAKVHIATGALVVMRSVQQGPNPQVPINQPIPNFPATPNGVTRMSQQRCSNILTSLDRPLPQGGVDRYRTAVREAIGLAAL